MSKRDRRRSKPVPGYEWVVPGRRCLCRGVGSVLVLEEPFRGSVVVFANNGSAKRKVRLEDLTWE